MEDRRWKFCHEYANISIKLLLVLIFVFSFASCKNYRSSLELENNFTKEQITDLNKINSFFIKEVLKPNNSNFKESFKTIFESVNLYGIDTLLNNVNYKKQKELYNDILKSTFNEIWELKTNTIEQFKGETYLLPKYKGKFQEFLKQLSKTNQLAKSCYTKMEQSGDFDILSFSNTISSKFNEIDFKDFNNQLIISIYYLSMIDDYERDEKTKKRRLEFNKERIIFK